MKASTSSTYSDDVPIVAHSSLLSSSEVMMYVDGELDGVRLERVAQCAKDDVRVGALVATLVEIGDQVREYVSAQAGVADGIVVDVMAQIDRGASYPGSARSGCADGLAGSGVDHADDGARSSIASVGRALLLRKTALAASGGIVMAAAAGIFLWYLAGSGLEEAAHTRGVDSEPTVSVDAVDFGANAGTIFYVAGETGVTTVVWLSENDFGGVP